MSLVPFYKSNSLNEALQSEILRKVANSEVMEPHETLSSYGYEKSITFRDLKGKFGDSKHRRRKIFSALMPKFIEYAKVTDDDFDGPLTAKEAAAFLKSSKDPGSFFGFWFVDDEWAAFTTGNVFKRIFKKEYTVNYEDFKKMIKDGIISKEDIESRGKSYWDQIKVPQGYYDLRRIPNTITNKEYVVNPARIKEFKLENAQVYFLDTKKFTSVPIRNKRNDRRANSNFYYSREERDQDYKDLAYTNQSNRKKILEKRKSEAYNDPNRKFIEILGEMYIKWLESLDLSDPKVYERSYTLQSTAREVANIFKDYRAIYEELFRMKNGYSLEGIDGLKKMENTLLQKIIKVFSFLQAEEKKKEEQEEK